MQNGKDWIGCGRRNLICQQIPSCLADRVCEKTAQKRDAGARFLQVLHGGVRCGNGVVVNCIWAGKKYDDDDGGLCFYSRSGVGGVAGLWDLPRNVWRFSPPRANACAACPEQLCDCCNYGCPVSTIVDFALPLSWAKLSNARARGLIPWADALHLRQPTHSYIGCLAAVR